MSNAPPAALSLQAAQVLGRYRLGGESRLRFLGGAGGFSGALFWKIAAAPGGCCLRRWPSSHPNAQRLRMIHAALAHAFARGCEFIPVPLEDETGATFIATADHLWQLEPWMPGVPAARGRALPGSAGPQGQLHSAMQALAGFHGAVESFSPHPPAPAPGILERLNYARQLASGGAEEILAAAAADRRPEIAALGAEIGERFKSEGRDCLSRLESAAATPVPIQVCIRDIRREHVLLERGRVSGMVDFGAMRADSAAGDVARLLGDFAQDAADWEAGLSAYQRLRPLTAGERALLPVYDAANVLLAGFNWLRWLCVERRQFDDCDSAVLRLREIASRRRRI